jgi:hypothetical protein
MTAVTREQIGVAFFNLIAGAAQVTATSRPFVHSDQVNETQMPFITILKTGELRARQTGGLPTLTINGLVSRLVAHRSARWRMRSAMSSPKL